MILWVVPFENRVRQSRPISKMAAMTKNKNFFKWPKRTQFWKRTTQESFQQSLVEIGSVVSEEKIFL
jgi:hypothetical protein